MIPSTTCRYARPRVLFAFLLWASSTCMAQVGTIPEMEGPRAAYQRALAEIRAERDTQAAPAKRAYAERLEDLKTRLTDEGDATAAAAVQKEASGMEPSAKASPCTLPEMGAWWLASTASTRMPRARLGWS